MKSAILSGLLAGVASAAASDHWAVLVAGSKGFWNYRHQSDVAHAYKVMEKNGIPKSNIIHFAYDDIAKDS